MFDLSHPIKPMQKTEIIEALQNMTSSEQLEIIEIASQLLRQNFLPNASNQNIYEANLAFRHSLSLETLAQNQSTPIVNDLRMLASSAWADEPIDEFTKWITAQRPEGKTSCK